MRLPPWAPPLWALLLGAASGYGFRNCIQAERDAGSFRCIQRFLRDAAGAAADLPPGTTALNLSHNALLRLTPAGLAHLPRLRTLDLAYNRLRLLDAGAFDGLGALDSLDVAHNALLRLTPGAFRGLVNLTRLWLQHNELEAVEAGALTPLVSLRLLVLRDNRLRSFAGLAVALRPLGRLLEVDACANRLCSLESGAALPPALRVLRLCNNSLGRLGNVSAGLFQGLQRLDLSYNNISDAEALGRLRLYNVSRLQLAGNPLDVFRLLDVSDVQPRNVDYAGLALGNGSVGRLCGRLWEGGRRLEELGLQHNGIRVLRAGALSPCPPLGTLDLSWNRLRELDCAAELLSAQQRAELRGLLVEHNLLQRVRRCRGDVRLPALATVSLRYNRILAVGPDAFGCAPALRVLRLNINTIAELRRGALRGLHNLSELRLDNNLLTDLYRDTFAGLRRLRTLNLRNNRVAVLFGGVFGDLGALETLDLGGNNLRHLTGASFQGLRSLRKLYLDGNRIRVVSATMFRRVEATLQVLDLKGNRLCYLSKRAGREPPFAGLRRLYDLKLQAQQPYGLKIVPHRFFAGLRSLRALWLSQNRLLAVPPDAFDDLTQLRYLSLADGSNGMGDLPGGVFKSLRRLESLDLENVGLHSLTLGVFGNLTRLRALRLAKNEVRTVTRAVTRRLRALRYLDLRKCPLSCACDNRWFQGWLRNRRVQLVYLYNYSCAGRPRGSYVHSFDTRVCFLHAGLYLFCGTAPALALFTALPVLHRLAYWRARYLCFVLRCWLRARRRRDVTRYRYDAFVSYHSGAERWVLRELVPNVERAGGARLCLHQRDFRAGAAVLDNIAAGVYGSRRTLCVVTRGFLRSEWCALEMQLASQRLLERRGGGLVAVFLEDIPQAELAARHRARRLLLRRTYLRWPPQPEARALFWARLREALRDGGDTDGDGGDGQR